jgi:hypothetical protein
VNRCILTILRNAHNGHGWTRRPKGLRVFLLFGGARPVACALLVTTFACVWGLRAQSNNPMSTEVKQAYETVKNNLLEAAEKIPEADYNFKPTPEVRSFAEVLNHVVMAQSHTCGALAGEKASGMTAATAKDAVIGALKQSFALCDKAYNSLTDANASEMVSTGRGQRTRLGALVGNSTHDVEQYAILSVYLRLKGIVPPSSEHGGR